MNPQRFEISQARPPKMMCCWIPVQCIGSWLILPIPTEISPFQMSARDHAAR
ncbi:hypothetical protein A2U01_0068974, partial [Trifolium medium]|nr:hypothetical protein [Trifolium medium]